MVDFTGAEYITKNAYLRFRKHWKKEYMRLARQIKHLKSFSSTFHYMSSMDNNNDDLFSGQSLQSLRAILSNYAATMMLDLEHKKLCARFSVAMDKLTDRTNS